MAALLTETETQANTQTPSIKQLEDSVMILEALNDDWDWQNAKLETQLVKYERDRGVMIRMYFSKASEVFSVASPVVYFKATANIFATPEWTLRRFHKMIMSCIDENATYINPCEWRFWQKVDPHNVSRKHFVFCVPKQAATYVWSMYEGDYGSQDPFRSINLKQETGIPYEFQAKHEPLHLIKKWK